ncbi:hypothetical protein BDV98DRAFT_577163 [Pterulicium gracile]|uniref:Uncharacterized protein n=1 Tax=Pterulicium gracile TaxID=1884261 RepID=A0A5C3Q1U4_9AGAR|nr:hypothetical protein BDV98DRAFT_577163 [Pterula gracilis]
MMNQRTDPSFLAEDLMFFFSLCAGQRKSGPYYNQIYSLPIPPIYSVACLPLTHFLISSWFPSFL